MLKNILANIPVLLISFTAAVTGTTAIAKVAKEIQPVLSQTRFEVREIQAATPTPTPTISATPTPTNELPAGNAGTITIADLAKHNKPGDCFVAFRGVVYDVSRHASWTTCLHHGARGGKDITALFPHSTSYFATLPKVGTLAGATNSTGTSSNMTSGKQDDDNEDEKDQNEREDEIEDHDKNEQEHELED